MVGTQKKKLPSKAHAVIVNSDFKIALLSLLEPSLRISCAKYPLPVKDFAHFKRHARIISRCIAIIRIAIVRAAIVCGIVLCLSSCAVENPPPEQPEVRSLPHQPPTETRKPYSLSQPPSLKQLAENAEQNSPAQAEAQLAEFGHHWFYGQGLGESLANVGTVVVFPPYALYLLGNAGLALAGYQPLHVTDALPETPKKYVLGVYDGITSVPGRITSGVAGEDYSEGQALQSQRPTNSKSREEK